MFSPGGNDGFNPAFDSGPLSSNVKGTLRSDYHSANVTGLLNSDVPPSLDVAVAVKDGCAASPRVSWMVRENAARPALSEATPAAARQISPSALPACPLAEVSIDN